MSLDDAPPVVDDGAKQTKRHVPVAAHLLRVA